MPEKDNRQRAERVKMIIMDVDGTLTDGTLLLLPDGEEVKSYNVLDGLGILLANLAGIKTGIISGTILEISTSSRKSDLLAPCPMLMRSLKSTVIITVV